LLFFPEFFPEFWQKHGKLQIKLWKTPIGRRISSVALFLCLSLPSETLKENGKTLKENLKNSKEKGALSIVHRVLTIKKKIMQRIYFIDEMTPLLEHSYTDKNGQPQVFAVQGFVLR
jgi:hypothetical protein